MHQKLFNYPSNNLESNGHQPTSLLRYTELSILALKGTEKVVKFCLNEAKSISADQCSVIFICWGLFFLYERQDIHCVPHFLGPFCISLWNEKKRTFPPRFNCNYMQLHIFDVWGYISWGVLCCFVSNQCFCSGTYVKTNKQKWAERWESTRRKVCAFCLFWPAHQIPQFVLACVCVRLD